MVENVTVGFSGGWKPFTFEPWHCAYIKTYKVCTYFWTFKHKILMGFDVQVCIFSPQPPHRKYRVIKYGKGQGCSSYPLFVHAIPDNINGFGSYTAVCDTNSNHW